MTNVKTIQVRQLFFDNNTNKLVLDLYREAALVSHAWAVWGSMTFFEIISKLNVGESMSYLFDSNTTSAIQSLSPARVPRTMFTDQFSLTTGSIVISQNRNHIGKVVKLGGLWVELEFFPSWVKGKNVRIETTLLNMRDTTMSEISPSKQSLSFTPFHDAG